MKGYSDLRSCDGLRGFVPVPTQPSPPPAHPLTDTLLEARISVTLRSKTLTVPRREDTVRTVPFNPAGLRRVDFWPKNTG